jgi:hypothetical protein
MAGLATIRTSCELPGKLLAERVLSPSADLLRSQLQMLQAPDLEGLGYRWVYEAHYACYRCPRVVSRAAFNQMVHCRRPKVQLCWNAPLHAVTVQSPGSPGSVTIMNT